MTVTFPGLHKEYKKVEKYFEFVSVKANQKEHRGFLTARKEWIKQHNEGGPERKRLKSKKELMEARKQLEVSKQTGGRFTCPKKQFVSVEAWNTKKHGELDQSKVVTENIMGQDVRGCWIAKGRKGVYDFEEYQDSAVQEKEIVHDSREDGPFGEIALSRKRKAVMDQVAEGSRARDKVAVEDAGSEMSLEQLLELATSGQASEVQKGSKAETEQEAACESGSSSNSDSSEEEVGPLAMFGPSQKQQNAQGKAKAAAGNKGKLAAASSAQPAAPKSKADMAAPASVPAQGKKVKKPSAEKGESSDSIDSAATLLADGRAQRALKNLQDKVAEWTASLENISFEDEPPAPDAQSQMAFKALCAKRVADLKIIQRQAKEYYKRMDKSTNKEAFAEELSKLQGIEDASSAFGAMLTQAPTSVASPEYFSKAFEAAKAFLENYTSQKMGTCFELKYSMAKASLNCLYGSFSKFCEGFLMKSEDMANLQFKMGRAKLEHFVVAEVESRILLMLRAIKTEDIAALATGQVAEIPNISEALNVCQAVAEHAEKYVDDFLPSALKADCILAKGLLGIDDLDVVTTSVAKCKELQAIFQEEKALPDSGAVCAFFLEHAIGKSLFDLASGRVHSGEKESKASVAFKELDERLAQVKTKHNEKQVLGAKLVTEELAPLQDMIQVCMTCVSSLQTVKGQESSNRKAAKGIYDRYQAKLAASKSSFSELAQGMLLSELRTNLSENLHSGLFIFLGRFVFFGSFQKVLIQQQQNETFNF